MRFTHHPIQSVKYKVRNGMTPNDTFYELIRQYAAGDLDSAAASAASIAGQGELYAQAARWLARTAQDGPIGAYLDAKAFQAFVDSDSNRAMYARLESMVAAAWDERRPARILDIGPGDGRVILGALRRAGQSGRRLRPAPAFDLVEPAANLLSKALEGLGRHAPGVRVQGFNDAVQKFVERAPANAAWDVCQATWSLQNLAPGERAPLFRWLRGRCRCLLVAEFDVHSEAYPLLSSERVRLIHDRYVAGLTEVTGRMDRGLEERIKQGFLMPILFGYFRTDARRSTYEQTIQDWMAEIEAAGFAGARRELIYPYWWADAYLVTADAADE